MIHTTLNRILEHYPYRDTGMPKLLRHLGKTVADDEPLAFLTVLESNGLNDALWSLRAEQQHANLWRMYAVRRARSVEHLLTDDNSRKAIEVAERHALGLATDEELATARDAAWVAARSAPIGAARGAAYAAAYAARGSAAAAAYTSRTAADAATWEVSYAATYVVRGAADAATYAAARAIDDARDAQTADFRAMVTSYSADPGCVAVPVDTVPTTEAMYGSQ